MEDISVRVLLEHYERMLSLYEMLESVSRDVFADIESGRQAAAIAARLKASAEIAEQIGCESRIIVSLKETLAARGLIDERDRGLVRKSEERLAFTLNRVVEQENKSRELIASRGVKISRR
jgi:predicted RNA methylase